MASAVVAIAVVILGAGLSLMAWMVKTLLDTASTLKATTDRLDSMEERDNGRLQRLEGVVFTAAWEHK